MTSEAVLFWNLQRHYKKRVAKFDDDLGGAIAAIAPLMLLQSGLSSLAAEKLKVKDFRTAASPFDLANTLHKSSHHKACGGDVIRGFMRDIQILGGLYARELTNWWARKGSESADITATKSCYRQSVVVWLNFDKIPEYDDFPHIDSLERNGMVVLRPQELGGFCKISLRAMRSSYRLYSVLARESAAELAELLANSRQDVERYTQQIYSAYMEPRIVRSILRAVLMQVPGIKELAKFCDSMLVVSRSGANGVFPVIWASRRTHSLSNVKLILIPHSIPTRTWVAGHAYLYSDLNLFPTARSYERLRRHGKDVAEKSKPLLKPRHGHLREIRMQSGDHLKDVCTIAITDPHVSNLQVSPRKSADSIVAAAKYTDTRVVVKEKNPRLATRLIRRFQDPSHIDGYVTKRSLIDLVSMTRIAFVIPSEKERYISNIFLDFVASGTPVVIVIPDDTNASEIYTNYDEAMAPLIYSVSEATNRFLLSWTANVNDLKDRLAGVRHAYFPGEDVCSIFEHLAEIS